MDQQNETLDDLIEPIAIPSLFSVPARLLPQNFVVPIDSALERNARLLPAIYASPHYARFSTLFQSLGEITTKQDNSTATQIIRGGTSKAIAGALRAPLHSVSAWGAHPSVKSTDVMVIGTCGRKFEIGSMVRLVVSLLRSQRTVSYLASRDSEEGQQISQAADATGLSTGITFIDPFFLGSRRTRLAAKMLAELNAREDMELLRSLLPTGIITGPMAEARLQDGAFARLIWERVAASHRFTALIVRNHFVPISAVASLDCVQRGILTITLQHGIVAGPLHFCPLTVHRYVASGPASVSVLRKNDANLAKTCNRSVWCKEYLLGGSINDPIRLLPPQRERACLLVIDQTTSWSSKYNGIGAQLDSLIDVAEQALRNSRTMRKIIVRPHPSSISIEHWLKLAASYPDRLEISHPGISLEFDLTRASACIGLFSGALVAAAACGVPPIFLWEPGWPYTPDLSAFDSMSVYPQSAIDYIDEMFGSAAHYTMTRNSAIEASKAYYYNSSLCEFEANILDKMLAPR